MLLWGTVNPDGEADTHTGVLLRQRDIQDLASGGSMIGKPVKIEHTGEAVGKVVSAWQCGSHLECVLQVNRDNIEGMFAQDFIKTGRCSELSLGYNITMQHSADGQLEAGTKEVLEVSIVKKGARHDCKIHGFVLKP